MSSQEAVGLATHVPPGPLAPQSVITIHDGRIPVASLWRRHSTRTPPSQRLSKVVKSHGVAPAGPQ